MSSHVGRYYILKVRSKSAIVLLISEDSSPELQDLYVYLYRILMFGRNPGLSRIYLQSSLTCLREFKIINHYT